MAIEGSLLACAPTPMAMLPSPLAPLAPSPMAMVLVDAADALLPMAMAVTPPPVVASPSGSPEPAPEIAPPPMVMPLE